MKGSVQGGAGVLDCRMFGGAAIIAPGSQGDAAGPPATEAAGACHRRPCHRQRTAACSLLRNDQVGHGQHATRPGSRFPFIHPRAENGSKPRVTWSVDDTRIGSIGDDGCSIRTASWGASSPSPPRRSHQAHDQVHRQCRYRRHCRRAGPRSADAQDRGGRVATQKFKWLYPYDRTVFRAVLPLPCCNWWRAAQSDVFEDHRPVFQLQQLATPRPPCASPFRGVWKGTDLTAGPTDTVA